MSFITILLQVYGELIIIASENNILIAGNTVEIFLNNEIYIAFK